MGILLHTKIIYSVKSLPLKLGLHSHIVLSLREMDASIALNFKKLTPRSNQSHCIRSKLNHDDSLFSFNIKERNHISTLEL